MSLGGSVQTLSDYLICDNATEAYIYFQLWTGYRKEDPKAAVLKDLAAVTQPYNDIRAAHVNDHQSLDNWSSLSLGTSSAAQKKMLTSERMRRCKMPRSIPKWRFYTSITDGRRRAFGL